MDYNNINIEEPSYCSPWALEAKKLEFIKYVDEDDQALFLNDAQLATVKDKTSKYLLKYLLTNLGNREYLSVEELVKAVQAIPIYHKYMHVEYPDSSDVEDFITAEGPIYIQPKIDGCNASVWWEDGDLRFGGRNRIFPKDIIHLVLTDDMPQTYKQDQQMARNINKDDSLRTFAEMYEGYQIFGEYLVRMKIKDYNPEAYFKFYVYDVYSYKEGRYLPPNEWRNDAIMCGCNIIPDICIMDGFEGNIKTCDLSSELASKLDENKYLFPEGYEGHGEGIVLKNYNYRNQYGRQVFIKVVSPEYKCLKIKKTLKNGEFEIKLVEEFYPDEITTKIVAEMMGDAGLWDRRRIPEMLGRCYRNFIEDRLWTILKKHKNPKIDFKILQEAVFNHIKRIRPDLF